MKHKSLLLANKPKGLFKSLSFLIVITIPAILSSQSPILGPGAQWIKEYWPDQETVGQNESGEDWFYDIELEKDALGTTTGYLYAGYTSYVQSDPYTIACFEYSPDPNPLAFEIEGYINGFRYPKLAETDLNGNIKWYKVYESYGGQFRKIIQIEDGYVAIGQAIFSCQTDIALHYNQTMDGESEVYETLDNVTGDRYKLLYVIKTDDDGVIEKAGVYGIESAEDALNYETSGYDIFLDADGNYVFTGTASIKVGTVDVTTAYMGKLDANLDLIWHNSYLVDNEYLSYAECSIEYDGFYYLAASQATAPDPITSPAEAPESSRIHILKINSSTGNVVTDGDFVIDASIDVDVDQFLDYPTILQQVFRSSNHLTIALSMPW